MTTRSGRFHPANLLAIWLLVASAWQVLAVDPVVSNVQAKQREGSRLVDITYDVADPGSPTYSQRKLDEKYQPKSVEQSNDFSKQNPTLHPMITCLPISWTRILRIACCLLGAMAAILMAPRVVA